MSIPNNANPSNTESIINDSKKHQNDSKKHQELTVDVQANQDLTGASAINSPIPGLTDAHYHMLHVESGISDEVIHERGYPSLPEPTDLLARGFAEVQAQTAPALGIPLWDVHGQQSHWQIRPDRPRDDPDGKPIKYETPLGDHNILNIHPRALPFLKQRETPLWITEGARKGDSLLSHGALCTIPLNGVWGFRGRRPDGTKGILPGWEDVALTGRTVYIVYDSDLATNDNVQRALDALVTFLLSRDAKPYPIQWPADYHAEKWGVDDFFAKGHTLDELLAMAPTEPVQRSTRRRKPAGPPPATPPEDPAASLGTVSPCSHTANAKRLVRHYVQTLRYVLGEGWILWTGQFWRPDPTSDGALATGFVSGLARHIAEEAAFLYAQAAQCADKDARKALYALAEQRGTWAAQSENAGVIASGLKLAKNALLLTHEQVDTNPWVFNCLTGTIDLRTGKQRQHDPADLITHLAPVAYEPHADCPTWKRFLLEVFENDAEMVAFLQRAIGWCLTGVVRDRALFFLYGPQGHNGKTTLVEVVRDLLGVYGEESFGYARKVDIATFMKSKNYEDNLRKTAQLVGARFVYSSEIGDDHRLNEQLIKDMTGGDTLEARRLYREAFNFTPTFKPWMYGNHKPDIRGTDNALWSRVHKIDFNVSFEDRKDPALPEKLRKELPGILNWALQGCLSWQQDGLQPPAKVQAATQAYRQEQDLVGRFLTECCVTNVADARVKATLLHKAYVSWCQDNGHESYTQTRFGQYLTTHGYPSDNNETGRGTFRKHIGLMATTDNEPEVTANSCKEPLETKKPSNDTVKSKFWEQYANSAKGCSGNPPHKNPLWGFSGTTVSTVSNSDGKSHETRINTGDETANPFSATVSTSGCLHPATTDEVMVDGSVLVRCQTCRKILDVRTETP